MAPPVEITADVLRRLNKNVPAGDGVTDPDRLSIIKPLLKGADWCATLGPGNTPYSVVTSTASSPVLDGLSLRFIADPRLDFETFIIQLDDQAGRSRPFAVSYPKRIRSKINDRFGQLPFLVMLNPLLKQNIEARFGGFFNTDPKKTGKQERTGYYIGYESLAMDPARTLGPAEKAKESFFFPLGWDYLFFQGWAKLNYLANPMVDPNYHGYPAQIAAAGKAVVLVAPLISAEDELGGFTEPSALLNALNQIQEFIIATKMEKIIDTFPQYYLGTVAIGAFSSGNRILKKILDRVSGLTEIGEVYMFDPPRDIGSELIESVMKWSTTTFSPMIRIYSNVLFDNMNKIVPTAVTSRPQVQKSTDGSRSVAVFTPNAWQVLFGAHIKAEWSAAFRKANGLNPALNDPSQVGAEFLSKNAFASFHQYIPALMLTDALSRGKAPAL